MSEASSGTKLGSMVAAGVDLGPPEVVAQDLVEVGVLVPIGVVGQSRGEPGPELWVNSRSWGRVA